MRKYLLLLFVLITSLSLFAQGKSITLEQCREMARQNYPEIMKYSLIEKSKEYNISNASKSWLPQISISGKASYQSDVTSIPLEGLESLLPGFEIPTVSKDQYTLQAEITQIVWDGGRTKAQKEIIESQSNIERSSIEVNLYALEERVDQIYFGILLQEEILKQCELLKEELYNNLLMIEALINNGVASLSDKQLFEVEILQVEQQMIIIRSSVLSYRRAMHYMIGKELTESVEFITPPIISQISGEVISRPELDYFDAQQNLLVSKEAAVNKDLMPSMNLFLNGGYGRPALNMLDNNFKPYAIGGVRITWNIGNLYTRKNNLNLIATQKSNIKVERDKFLYNTQIERINQDEAIVKTRQLMESDKQIYRLRESVKCATEAKVKNGIATATDLVTDISAKSRAERQLQVRKIELLSQIYSLIHTVSSEKQLLPYF
ncbi:MAG: TolC family protein [Rikenellaceae bacterium]